MTKPEAGGSLLAVTALCAVGAEKAVSNELKKLGATLEEGGFGRIRFRTDISGLYRSLMGLRAADRILLETTRYKAADFDELFDGIKAVPWEDYIPPQMGIRISKVRTNRSALSAETSIQAVVHKAAAERLCTKRRISRLPENGNEAELRVYVEKDQASILLDLSGDPLFKRGYRSSGGIAPLRETTAAAIILLSGWRRKFPFYDPFCGSGTLAIEAALYAWDIAPGMGRRFALDKLLIADKNTERTVREEFLGKVDFSRLVRIGGSDSDKAAVTVAKANLERAIALTREKGKVNYPEESKLPVFKVLPMEEAGAQGEEGFIITNPPYGRRLGDTAGAEKIYTEMGNLARRFPGWRLAVITDHAGFESFFGNKADSCREITNGAINLFLFQYEKL